MTEFCDFNIGSMARDAYNKWCNEWDRENRCDTRTKSLAAVQPWLDQQYPGSVIIDCGVQYPCIIRFTSQADRARFILTWG